MIGIHATLAVSGDFSLYRGELGLAEARTACWDSPFDYAAHALLYVPRELPEPNSPEHTRAVVECALPVIRASTGRAFLLFTTLRGMRLAHELLRDAFAREGLAYPLLQQGEGSRSELLERFRRLGNAVLVASASFWEGVDDIADELGFADGAGVTADHDDAPDSFVLHTGAFQRCPLSCLKP